MAENTLNRRDWLERARRLRDGDDGDFETQDISQLHLNEPDITSLFKEVEASSDAHMYGDEATTSFGQGMQNKTHDPQGDVDVASDSSPGSSLKTDGEVNDVTNLGDSDFEDYTTSEKQLAREYLKDLKDDIFTLEAKTSQKIRETLMQQLKKKMKE